MRGVSFFAAVFSIFSLAQADTQRELDTPRLIQVTTNPGVDQLPDDGGSFCVPTSTTMILYYLQNQGFTGVTPSAWNYADPGDAANLAAAYNLDRIMGGLIHTSPYQGTSPGNWQDGINLYLGLRGYGAAHATATAVSAPSPGDPFLGQIADSISSPDEATVLLLHWYYPSGKVQGGHGTALVDVDQATQMLTIHNPEPSSAIKGAPDTMANAQQTFDTSVPPNSNVPDGVYLVTPDNPLDRYAQAAYLLNIDLGSVARGSSPNIPFELVPADTSTTSAIIGTNGGDLTATIPLFGAGIDKRALGTLTLTESNTTTGDNNVGGGSLASTLAFTGGGSATPFGTGNMTVNGGTVLALQPNASGDPAVHLEIAGGAGKQFSARNGLATLALDPSAVGSVTTTLGGSTDGTTPSVVVSSDASTLGALLIGPGTGTLGGNVKVLARGSGGNLPSLINGKMTSPQIVATDSSGNLGFVAYDATNGFTPAATLVQNSFADASGEILDTTGAFSIGADSAALALVAGASIGETAASTITLGAPGQSGGLILNNGASISASGLAFTGDAFIYASGGSSIDSQITTPAGHSLFLAATGTAPLSITSAISTPELVIIGAGAVHVQDVGSAITVQSGTTLTAAGTLGGAVTVDSGAELVLAGGTVSGSLSLTANSAAFSDTWEPGGTISGTGTVLLNSPTTTLTGIIGSQTSSGALAFTATTNGATVVVSAPLMLTLSALKSDGDGQAGIDWSVLRFTGEGGLFVGPSSNGGGTIGVQVNFMNDSLVPSADPFWQSPHTWQFIDLDGFNVDPDVSWSVYDQNIFSFSELGKFSFASDGELTWAPIPEPSTMALVLGGLAIFGLVGRNLWKIRT